VRLARSASFQLAVLSIAIVGVLLVTAVLLGEVVHHGQSITTREAALGARLERIHELRHAFSDMRLALNEAAGASRSRSEGWRQRAERNLLESYGRVHEKADGLKDFAPQAARDIQARLARVQDRRKELAAALAAGRDSSERHFRELRADIVAIAGSMEVAQYREITAFEAERTVQRAAVIASLRWAWATTAITVVLSLLLAFTVSRSLVRPLRRVVAAVRRVAAGEGAVHLPPSRPDEFGDIAVALRQFHDQAEKLRTIAYRDPLTGLANRARIEDALHAAVVRCARGGTSFALLFLDLDNFKSVNDSLGHSAGDRFLREAARRLQRLVPEQALIGRYSGDKFAIVVEGLRRDGSQQAQLRTVADALLKGMAEPYQSTGDFLYLTVSIGIALYPVDGQSPEQIMSSAEAAMYLAKRSGRNVMQFASPELTEDARRKLLLSGDIRRGLAAGEFVPYYQPIVDVRTGAISGAEALLRWHHPQRGTVLPNDFIRAAEDSGLIGDLGERCLTLAHEQAGMWNKRARAIPIAVNLSARQLRDQRLLTLVQQLQSDRRLPPQCLEFEITESAVMERPEQSQQTLQEIRRLGHKLGIDDFGTGHSALGYLQRFPIDRIKIDRTFVERVDSSRQSRAIISATLALAENLGLDVVAEGVENTTQLQHMRQLGCSLQQGYFFTPALPAEEFEAWLASRPA
jgi:diguanylate cyclase (GGDEF)-like protein